MSWGYHLLLNAGKCLNTKAIRCKYAIELFSKHIVKDIDMIAFGEPQIVMFGEGNKKGYTLVQLIETSNITAHFCEETNDFYLDVFSFKDFDPKKVITLSNVYFQPSNIKYTFLKRQASHQTFLK